MSESGCELRLSEEREERCGGGGVGGGLIMDFSHNETMHSFESIHTGFPSRVGAGGRLEEFIGLSLTPVRESVCLMLALGYSCTHF